MDYREQALKLYPHLCGRCGRSFVHSNLHELTVHHRDHDHSNNPPDGSNWELLCIYCHENEHARFEDARAAPARPEPETKPATHRALAGLSDLLKKKQK